MDVTSYFENVLGTSNMVRVPFPSQNFHQAKSARRRKDEPGDSHSYVTQTTTWDDVLSGRLAESVADGLLDDLDDRDREKAEKDGVLHALIVPRSVRSDSGSLGRNVNHEALLVVPAALKLDRAHKGALACPDDLDSRSPWMPRPLLREESADKGVQATKAEVAFGAYASYERYVASREAEQAKNALASMEGAAQWHLFATYAMGLFTSVFDATDKDLDAAGLKLDEAAYVLVDTTVNASAPIENLYRLIRTTGAASEDDLRLYRSLTSLEAPRQVPARLNPADEQAILTHAGTMSRDYPLADSQRLAVRQRALLRDGQVLAVSGPPGTGKTTLLESIVADLVVQRALAGQPAPVIVGTSTNNQAVTNIIDAFGKIEQAEGQSVYNRWLPDVTYEEVPKEAEAAKAGGREKAGGKASRSSSAKSNKSKEDEPKYRPVVQDDRPFHSMGVYSPASAKVDLAHEKNYLTDDKGRQSSGLYGVCRGPHFWKAAEERFCASAKSYFGRGFPSVGLAVKACHQALAQVDQARRDLVEAVCAGRGASPKAAKALDLLTSRGAVDAKGRPIPQKALASPAALDQALDTTVRPLEFWLAVHCNEGDWLADKTRWQDKPQQGQDALPAAKDRTSSQPESVREYHRQMAAIAPLTVMTLYRLPNQFIYADKNNEKNMAGFGDIDLLVVDEAGQVDTAVGAAAFSLARQAVVVGDVQQLPPVWGLEPEVDRQIAQAYASRGDDWGQTWQHLRDRGLTASRYSSIMRAAQRTCPWSHEYVDASSGETHVDGGLFLSEHRRCLDQIIAYCNDLLYNGQLEPMRGGLEARKAKLDLPPMGFCPVEGKSSPAGTSRKNAAEARAIAQWIKRNLPGVFEAYRAASKDGQADPAQLVGVVTPFKAQAHEIERALGRVGQVKLDGQGHKLADLVTVGTAHRLQGAERPVVLFSLVYDASGSAFFVESNPNLMNVAVSRAKDAFVVFGSDALLGGRVDDGVLGWLNYYCYKHKVEPAAEPEAEAGQGVDATRAADAANGGQALSLTKAIGRAREAGWWPQGWPTAAKDVNPRLAQAGYLAREASGYMPTDRGREAGIGVFTNDKGTTWAVYTDAVLRAVVEACPQEAADVPTDVPTPHASAKPADKEAGTADSAGVGQPAASDYGTCPRCGGKLVLRNGKFGPFVGCANFPKCRYTGKA